MNSDIIQISSNEQEKNSSFKVKYITLNERSDIIVYFNSFGSKNKEKSTKNHANEIYSNDKSENNKRSKSRNSKSKEKRIPLTIKQISVNDLASEKIIEKFFNKNNKNNCILKTIDKKDSSITKFLKEKQTIFKKQMGEFNEISSKIDLDSFEINLNIKNEGSNKIEYNEPDNNINDNIQIFNNEPIEEIHNKTTYEEKEKKTLSITDFFKPDQQTVSPVFSQFFEAFKIYQDEINKNNEEEIRKLKLANKNNEIETDKKLKLANKKNEEEIRKFKIDTDKKLEDEIKKFKKETDNKLLIVMNHFSDLEDVLVSVDNDLLDLKQLTNYFSNQAQPTQIRKNLEYLILLY